MRKFIACSFASVVLTSMFIVDTASAKKVADTVKPMISGATNQTIFVGQSFNPKARVTAKDDKDGNITKKIKISGKYNVKKVGRYILTYTVTDKAKNTRTVQRFITVKKDKVKPIITGAKSTAIKLGSKFNPLSNIKVIDNIDKYLLSKIKISGKVNRNVPGKYKLTYSVADSSNNITTAIRYITVTDTIAPIILGTEDLTLEVGSTFDPLKGVTASDNVNGDVTKAITINQTINTNKPGEYVIVYAVKDRAGNETSVERHIYVKDQTVPVFYGLDDQILDVNDSVDLLKGVKAIDNLDGDITSNIVLEGSVDTTKENVNTINYTVTDKNGNKTSKTRTFTVKAVPVTKVSIKGDSYVKVGKIISMVADIEPSNATNPGITWTSSNELVATVSSDGKVTGLSAGTATINAISTNGIEDSKTITVDVKPNVQTNIYSYLEINSVIMGIGIGFVNYDDQTLKVQSVQIKENGNVVANYSADNLENNGIITTVPSLGDFGMSISSKLGYWAGSTEVIITIEDELGQTFTYSKNL